MEATFKPFFVQDAEHQAISETTGLACSIGREMAERWPHAIGRIRIALSGGLSAPKARGATGEAFMLGLSGLTGRGSDPRKVAAIFGLNARMMAIRLNGRTLVAFTPDRDIRFGAEFDGRLAGRVRAGPGRRAGNYWGSSSEFCFRRRRATRCPRSPAIPMRPSKRTSTHWYN